MQLKGQTAVGPAPMWAQVPAIAPKWFLHPHLLHAPLLVQF